MELNLNQQRIEISIFQTVSIANQKNQKRYKFCVKHFPTQEMIIFQHLMFHYRFRFRV